jgi:glycine/D-amino acid oxidase-like deaminating enzyme/nitrite reductase/ring-hydroxylating ferredoxin subunit
MAENVGPGHSLCSLQQQMDAAIGSPAVWATEELPTQPTLDRDLDVDALVIGGGLTGLNTAYLLAGAGLDVALVDRTRLASGDSGHTTAHLTAVTDVRPNDLVKLVGRTHAAALWAANQTALGQIQKIVDHLHRPTGFATVPAFLHLPFDAETDLERERQTLMKDAEFARHWGLDAVFEERVPLMNRPGVKFADQALIHPTKYIHALVDTLRAQGVPIFERSEATFEPDPERLTCNGHTIRSGWVVIATHNPLQGRQSTAPAALIQTQLSAYTSYALHATVTRTSVPVGLFWDTSDPYRYVRIEAADEGYSIVAGGEDHKTGQMADTRAPQAALDKWFRRLFPDARITHHWSGQVLETPDGMPIIGEVGDRQWIATGFGGNGITFGMLSAMLVRDTITGRPNPWSRLVSPNRVAGLRDPWDYVRENVDYPYYLLKRILGPADDRSLRGLKPGDGTVIKLDGRAVAASRDDDGLYRLRSAVCTHLGCLVVWNQVERTWDCPCHGSRFSKEGEVLRGPAERGLDGIHHRD